MKTIAHRSSILPGRISNITRSTAGTTALFAALALAGAAFAGPDVDEGNRDAGATPTTAKQIRGQGPINTIAGTTATALEQGDIVDMFIMYVPNPSTFSLEVDASLTTFDTTLWLFRIIPETATLPMRAVAIAGNDDKSATDTASKVTFPAGSGWGPGIYAVAIAPKGMAPYGLDIHRNPVALFNTSADPTALLTPTPFGKREPVVLWLGSPVGTGVYRSDADNANMIPTTPGSGVCGDVLSGNCFIGHPTSKGCDEQPCCETVCRIDPSCCTVAWDNSCATIADQNCVRCNFDLCPADLTNDGVVDDADINFVKAHWGVCK